MNKGPLKTKCWIHRCAHEAEEPVSKQTQTQSLKLTATIATELGDGTRGQRGAKWKSQEMGKRMEENERCLTELSKQAQQFLDISRVHLFFSCTTNPVLHASWYQ